MKLGIFDIVLGSLLIITVLIGIPINILAGNTSVIFTGIAVFAIGTWRLIKGISRIRRIRNSQS